ncbi:DUF3108 domain-containing protein [Motilimonas cestriensis]|uniref:DUF3108 domain-containing protein n=1 Tax=Motilimonas cestriensis TaxID=2742685 RepID=A0ABS8W3W2_9GAMM|nr:DUF3108 domain-containing protein [Motilimonas cestriensis]MCE2593634.1 DUF3108 domain-containing protein [Motilimonas cestriensis]
MWLLNPSKCALLPLLSYSKAGLLACTVAFTATVQANDELTNNELEAPSQTQQEPQHEAAVSKAISTSCTNSLSYKFFYKSSHVGNINRQQKWHNQQADMSTSGEVSFLMFNFTGNHQSKVYWNDTQKQYLTREFKQDVKGLTHTKVSALFSDNGLVSKVIANDEKAEYSDFKLPILDFEAISTQMRQNLISNTKEFDFLMQKSDELGHYYFSVVGEEDLNVLGKNYRTIKVQQVKKKDRKLYLWFAPELDYQLVKSTYKRKIIDIEANLSQFDLGCAKLSLNEAKPQQGL